MCPRCSDSFYIVSYNIKLSLPLGHIVPVTCLLAETKDEEHSRNIPLAKKKSVIIMLPDGDWGVGEVIRKKQNC